LSLELENLRVPAVIYYISAVLLAWAQFSSTQVSMKFGGSAFSTSHHLGHDRITTFS